MADARQLWYNHVLPGSQQYALVRAIGRWSLAALVVNSIIGSGIFGLPSDVARLIGRSSPWAVLVAGAAAGVIMACFAEVASQFTQAGGPYLYARAAFGRLVGIEMGWMLWLVRLAAPAATANLFVTYCGEFWAEATKPLPRFLILTFLYGVLTLINYRGVRASTQVSNVFTVAKLVPLFLVAIAGTFYLMSGHPAAPRLPAGTGTGVWLKACLLLVFAYGGFETALTPLSEAKNPRRDAAFALFTALITCTLLYTAIQWVVIGILPDPGHSERPLADVARLALGHGGAAFVAAGALVSVVGYLSANMLGVPRITFALAENGDFPSIFAAVHPRFRTPYVSIVAFALLSWLLALLGSFSWNATLSAVARLLYYGLVCVALPVFRRRQPGAALFRLPGGTVFAVLGAGICAVLIAGVNLSGSLILLATALVAFCNWLLVRRGPTPGAFAP
ncbi:MAG: APC family permease [Terriglobales bacterium]